MLTGRSKVVAIAGATGDVGRHLSEELLLHKEFKVVLLLRKEKQELIQALHSTTSTTGNNENLVYEIINFQDTKSIETALSKHNVDTIISTLSSMDGSHVEAEHNLIDTASLIGHVKRYAPSVWQGDVDKLPWDNYDYLRELQTKLDSLSQEGKLSYTIFTNGVFMNYLGYGAKPRIDSNNPGSKETRLATGYLKPFPFNIDPVEMTASIPGTGDEQFVITTVQDTARYVAAACKVETLWNKKTGFIVGDVTSFNKLKDAFETTFGKKFKVTYESKQELEVQLQDLLEKCEANPDSESLFAGIILVQSKLIIANNDCIWDNALSGEIDFVPTTVEQFIKQWWE